MSAGPSGAPDAAQRSEAARLLEVLLSHIPLGVTVYDADDRLLLANAQAQSFWRLDETMRPGDSHRVLTRRILEMDAGRDGPIDDAVLDARLAEIRAGLAKAGLLEDYVRLRDGRVAHMRRRLTPEGYRVSTVSDATALFEAMDSLQRSESRYRAIVEDRSEMISRFDENCRLTYVNPAYARAFGKPAEALVGTDFTEVLGGQDEQVAFRERLRALTPEHPVMVDEYPETLATGEVRWHHWTDRALYDEAGRLTGYQAVGRDVTERHLAEAAVRESEARLRAVVEDQSEYILRFRPETRRISFHNHALADVLGLHGDLLSETDVFEALGQARSEHVSAAMELIALDRPLTSGEVSFLDGEGARIVEHWTLRGLYDEAGRLQEYQGVGRDITEQSVALDALERSQRHFKSIAEAHPVPVLIVRLADKRVLHASPAAVPLLGPDEASLLRERGDAFIAEPAERAAFFAEVERVGRIDRAAYAVRATDGSVVPAELTARAVDYDGHHAVAIGVVDISERLRAEEELGRHRDALAQSEKMSALGSLLASVAHELNNPLAIVLGQAQLLIELAEDARSTKRAERIIKAAERCKRIVETFLAMARQRPPSRSEVDIGALVQGAIELTQYAARSSDIALETEIDAALPTVLGDADQLTQVVVNLLINAQQALAEMPPPRLVRVVCEPVSDGVLEDDVRMVRLTVSDNGPGVPEAIRARIFEPFFTTKPEGAGTGIGLSVSGNIVRGHGGRLRVEDNEPDGARFIVELPVEATGAGRGMSQAAPASEVPEDAPLTVLVVDDEADIAATVVEMLEIDGHRAEVATSGRLALDLLAEHGTDKFDAILSDVRMPDLDGPGLFRAASALDPALPDRIAFITGDTLGGPVSRALEETGRPVLAKPFEVDDLRRLLRRLRQAEPD